VAMRSFYLDDQAIEHLAHRSAALRRRPAPGSAVRHWVMQITVKRWCKPRAGADTRSAAMRREATPEQSHFWLNEGSKHSPAGDTAWAVGGPAANSIDCLSPVHGCCVGRRARWVWQWSKEMS